MRLNRWAEQGHAGAASGVADARAETGRAAGRDLVGQHDHQAAPRCGGNAEKGPQTIGPSHGGWTTNLHLLARDDCGVLTLGSRPAKACRLGPICSNASASAQLGPGLLMDRPMGMPPPATSPPRSAGAPPCCRRATAQPWAYDHSFYKCRNEVKRLFRRAKRFRHITTTLYDKFNAVFLAFIFDTLR